MEVIEEPITAKCKIVANVNVLAFLVNLVFVK